MAKFDPWDSGGRVRNRDEFVDGLKCFRSEDWEGALRLFRAATEGTDFDDIYHKRYASFLGLTRVHMGDRNGVKLCREAANALMPRSSTTSP